MFKDLMCDEGASNDSHRWWRNWNEGVDAGEIPIYLSPPTVGVCKSQLVSLAAPIAERCLKRLET